MESKIYVHGGKILSGEVTVDGSKNSALACLAAASLSEDAITLTNVPRTMDIDVMVQILQDAGKKVKFLDENTVTVHGCIQNTVLQSELASKIRASAYCLGLFLATNEKAQISLPGGDKIGDRPLDIHLECMEDLGVEYEIKSGAIHAERKESITEEVVFLSYPSVGATCNQLILASKINRKIILKNVSKEPEIVDLANLLSAMGVSISGAGSDSITIKGTEQLKGGIAYEIMPDRIESGIIMTAVAITGGACKINNCIPTHNLALIRTYKKSGVEVIQGGEDSLYIDGKSTYKPINAIAMPYPGMPTDLQPLLAVYAQRCEGESVIKDSVFPERFSYVNELRKMGANIVRRGNMIQIIGNKLLSGAPLKGSDIRATTALVCAGLIAKDDTIISGMYHINRAYPNLCGMLQKLGADIVVM